jgi:hypothetical protein
MERKTKKALREAHALAKAQPGWKSRETRRNEGRVLATAKREKEEADQALNGSRVRSARQQPPRSCHEQTLTPEQWECRAQLREHEAALRHQHEAALRHQHEAAQPLVDATDRLAELTNKINGILRTHADPVAVDDEACDMCRQLDLHDFRSDANALHCIDALIGPHCTPSF